MDGEELLIADIRGGKILRYSQNGAYVGAFARPGRGRDEFHHPSQILPVSGGYLLKNRLERLLWLDADFNVARTLHFPSDSDRPAVSTLTLLDQVLLQDTLFGYGSFRQGNSVWKGFLRAQLGPDPQLEAISETPHHSAATDLQSSTIPMIALADGVPYALRQGEPPFIMKLTSPHDRLKAFPGGFERLPKLPENQGPGSDAARFKALEESTVATGLYGRQAYLYLLTRRPASSGSTYWQLHQIDPKADVLVRTLNLPTRAAHIFLVPGSAHWAIVEKGPVVGPGQQSVSGAVLVPAPWIEDRQNDVLRGEHAELCR